MKYMKEITLAKKLTDGRNHHGHTTVHHRGGGFSKRYRLIDFGRNIKDIRGRILRVEEDPLRSANISLIFFDNGFLAYALSIEKALPGTFVITSERALHLNGNALPLKMIPLGFHVSCLELYPNTVNTISGRKGAQLARAAGASAQLLKRRSAYTLLRLNSGELRWLHSNCFATIGSVSPSEHKTHTLTKAGQSRWLGRRPTVRGTAKNPVDHPHGGGQGKTSGGRCSVSPWAQLTKGKRTRKKTSSFIYRFRY